MNKRYLVSVVVMCSVAAGLVASYVTISDEAFAYDLCPTGKTKRAVRISGTMSPAACKLNTCRVIGDIGAVSRALPFPDLGIVVEGVYEAKTGAASSSNCPASVNGASGWGP